MGLPASLGKQKKGPPSPEALFYSTAALRSVFAITHLHINKENSDLTFDNNELYIEGSLNQFIDQYVNISDCLLYLTA
ncbi:protein of unknown function [Vibrio tapetis subsp. tapetis]|uniref:Uncharacterized protein n=1 Tax=Vibrio tapetis subsp. tapetis TaxID=1671868 RepID=A0A2N8ZJ32_9VIBR|nr:protein of unknown function [Vibrio tapetis subsp. tapetis]